MTMSLELSNKNLATGIIPLKDVVIFPGIIVSLTVSTVHGLKLIEHISTTKVEEVVAVLSNSEKPNGIEAVGCLIKVSQIIHLNDTTVKIIAESISKVRIENIVKEDDLLKCHYIVLKDEKEYSNDSMQELKDNLLNSLTNYVNVSKRLPNSLPLSLKKVDDLDSINNVICSHLPVNVKEKQHVLEVTDLIERVAYVNSLLDVDLDLINVEKKIRERVKQQMEKNQKDYYLNEQVKAIQKELNNGEDVKDENKEFIQKAKKIKLSKEAREKVELEIKKLSMMNPISAEATVVRNYIEWVLGIPWNNKSSLKLDLEKAEQYLDEEHYALRKVKDRIVEYLAVLKKSKLLKAPILCLVGPPGVGKTSLARSIAKAAGREFVRISLGGVRDEAEIRGHRRTYIGAMPGKIVQSMKKAKVSNPVVLLDEIDKMSSDYRGDPASAMLEVLDAEQNSTFVDHYIEVEYDLSEVMFITTANSLNIPEALLDRMEVIELNGYAEEEKLEIAKRHLLPKKMKEAALLTKEFAINDNALLSLIRNYTRESGVRELERVIGTVVRKVAKDIVQGVIKKVEIDLDNVEYYAGVPKFKDKEREVQNLVGVTTGLAWTRVGGDILYIEALKAPGKGEIKITGKLGEVMQESVKAAYSLIHSNATVLGLSENVFKNYDIHIHVPEGATPKDGPSAGVAMVTSIYSVLSDKKIRNDIAMTGEITLRGRVLPIGGVREKLLAALRAGIKNVIIPEENKKDLSDLPKNALQQLNIINVSNFKDVLLNAIEDIETLNHP